MEKMEKFAGGLMGLSGIGSVYLGGAPFVILFLSSAVLLTGVTVMKKKQAS